MPRCSAAARPLCFSTNGEPKTAPLQLRVRAAAEETRSTMRSRTDNADALRPTRQASQLQVYYTARYGTTTARTAPRPQRGREGTARNSIKTPLSSRAAPNFHFRWLTASCWFPPLPPPSPPTQPPGVVRRVDRFLVVPGTRKQRHHRSGPGAGLAGRNGPLPALRFRNPERRPSGAGVALLDATALAGPFGLRPVENLWISTASRWITLCTKCGQLPCACRSTTFHPRTTRSYPHSIHTLSTRQRRSDMLYWSCLGDVASQVFHRKWTLFYDYGLWITKDLHRRESGTSARGESTPWPSFYPGHSLPKSQDHREAPPTPTTGTAPTCEIA
jgi:hypothetical protein